MRLIAELERAIAQERSLFRAQLLREDLARLGRLRELARAAPDAEALAGPARRLGWTQGDQRTGELEAQLQALVRWVHDYEKGATGEAAEEAIARAWHDLVRARLERLVGCLSMRPPPPEGR